MPPEKDVVPMERNPRDAAGEPGGTTKQQASNKPTPDDCKEMSSCPGGLDKSLPEMLVGKKKAGG